MLDEQLVALRSEELRLSQAQKRKTRADLPAVLATLAQNVRAARVHQPGFGPVVWLV